MTVGGRNKSCYVGNSFVLLLFVDCCELVTLEAMLRLPSNDVRFTCILSTKVKGAT